MCVGAGGVPRQPRRVAPSFLSAGFLDPRVSAVAAGAVSSRMGGGASRFAILVNAALALTAAHRWQRPAGGGPRRFLGKTWLAPLCGDGYAARKRLPGALTMTRAGFFLAPKNLVDCRSWSVSARGTQTSGQDDRHAGVTTRPGC